MSVELKVEAIDLTSPQTVALSILPWIEDKTGLKRSEKLPLPQIEMWDYIAGAAGAYDDKENSLRIRFTDWSDFGIASMVATIAHELVHWLQNANGWFEEDRNVPREFVEKLAYSTQKQFFQEVLNIDPEKIGFTEERINSILEIEKLKGLMLQSHKEAGENTQSFLSSLFKPKLPPEWYDWNVCFTVGHFSYFGLVAYEGQGLYAISAGGLFLLMFLAMLHKPKAEKSMSEERNKWGSLFFPYQSEKLKDRLIRACPSLALFASLSFIWGSIFYL